MPLDWPALNVRSQSAKSASVIHLAGGYVRSFVTKYLRPGTIGAYHDALVVGIYMADLERFPCSARPQPLLSALVATA